jgi:Divergent InlB B-repeat domain
MVYFRLIFWPLFAITLAFGLLTTDHVANAAQLTLSWNDASDNEDGFGIERRPGTSGTFARVASVSSNVSTYTDLSLTSSTTYCYRVFAFNTAGNSAYTNEICGTTLAANFTLNVGRSGTGIGTVTSSPAGINCGSDCAEGYTSGTLVKLTATPASGSSFAGWSGNTACSNGSVTVNGDITCTALFNLITTYTLTVTRSGTGSGTVTSSPAGINCGSTCLATLSSGTAVTLSAIPSSGSTFAGWTGNADCADGSVTVTSNMGCTATFNASGYALTTSVVNEVTSSGSAAGRIVSNPIGIDCGTDCTENYTSGRVITLTPMPAANSRFVKWAGDADCSDGSVTMNGNKNCTATFATNIVSLSVSKKGNGTVTSTPSGISCGTTCSFNFLAGTVVSLRATPTAGFTFSGWIGGCTGTATCTVTLSSTTTVTAIFSNNLSDKIGIYRPSTGEWFLDRNGTGGWEDCSMDTCAEPFAGIDGVPVVGDWNGSGKAKLGLFVPETSQWFLDANGNGIWEDCGVDACVEAFGQSTDLPAVGQWTTTPGDWIGVFRPSEAKWYLDLNRNGVLNGCRTDACPSFSNYVNGDIAVAGDWTGSGNTQLGLFRPSTGEWFLNRNGNRAWNGCKKDTCIASFGRIGDFPIIGDWNGTGISKIGVARPTTGEWLLDLNGNGKWDGPTVDIYISGYGEEGDIPVVGRW